MSNAFCADPGLEEPVRQEGGGCGSRAPTAAWGCGWGMWQEGDMAEVTSPLQLRHRFCCGLTVLGSTGNINWINVY